VQTFLQKKFVRHIRPLFVRSTDIRLPFRRDLCAGLRKTAILARKSHGRIPESAADKIAAKQRWIACHAEEISQRIALTAERRQTFLVAPVTGAKATVGGKKYP
jgi:hypothetical protein